MTKFTPVLTDFFEDTLPDGQKPILTTNVKLFNAFTQLLTDPSNGYRNMGVAIGAPGIGKTVSIQALFDNLPSQPHMDLPPVVKIKVKPRSTPKALATDIVMSVKDRPRGRTIFEVADEAADAIVRNDLELIIIDEADRLNEDSFEVLRHLFDKTGCPILLVGLEDILQVINRHEKFRSRVGLHMNFFELKFTEVIELVLPNLVFECWNFDPNEPLDCEMGEYIWKMVKPSLRKLRNLLQIASHLAERDQKPRITQEIIEEASNWMPAGPNEIRARLESQLEDQPGEREYISALRNEAKHRRKGKNEK